jgi:hypothetical protein
MSRMRGAVSSGFERDLRRGGRQTSGWEVGNNRPETTPPQSRFSAIRAARCALAI